MAHGFRAASPWDCNEVEDGLARCGVEEAGWQAVRWDGMCSVPEGKGEAVHAASANRPGPLAAWTAKPLLPPMWKLAYCPRQGLCRAVLALVVAGGDFGKACTFRVP